jgi:hypothetical protein
MFNVDFGMKNQELKYNLYFEIEPLYYVSRLLGLAPFSFGKKKAVRQKKIYHIQISF